MIQLGREVTDQVTGFEGVATARVEYLNGCIQYCIKPRCVDGKMLPGEYIDEEQLVVSGDGIFTGEPDEPNGGPSPDAPPDGYAG